MFLKPVAKTPQLELPPLSSFTLDGYTLELARYLGMDYTDVADACAELPAVNEWINEKLQGYIEMLYVAKKEVKEAEATAFFALRKGEFEDSYGGKPTIDAINQAVVLDPEVKKKSREVAVLAAWCNRLRGIQESLSMKLDLVRSSEATRRKIFEDTSS